MLLMQFTVMAIMVKLGDDEGCVADDYRLRQAS
jgi:hypothetical protein